MTDRHTARALTRLLRPLRSWSLAAWFMLAFGCVALVLGSTVWLSRLPGLIGPAWVFLAWGAALLVLVSIAVPGVRALRGVTPKWLARRLEERGPWRGGALGAFLEPPAPGTSADLLKAADLRSGDELALRGVDVLRPEASRFHQRAWGGAFVGALGLLVFASAGPVRGPASALWDPGRAWEAIRAPVTLTAERSEVDRNATVALELRATGQREAVLWMRGPGEPWKARTVHLDTTGRAVERVGPLRTDLFARLSAGRRSSDTVHVRVRIPAFLGSLSVTAHYPRYLSLADEPMPLDGDTLLLPAGTRLTTTGEATAGLASASWTMNGTALPLEVRGNRFSGSMRPSATGSYELRLITAGGAALAGDSIQLPVRVIPDRAPLVEIPVPGRDTTAPLSLRVPLVIEAQDDYGVAAVEIESRRISRLGFADSSLRQPVTLPGGAPERALLTFELDLNRRGLLPGDTLRYFATVTDNSPGAQSGRSREYVLRLPTMSEVRAATREATADVGTRLDSVLARSRELQRRTEDLGRERSRAPDSRAGGRDGSERSMSYEEVQRAQGIAEAQQELQKQAEQLQEAVRELQRSADAAGITDPEFQKRLEEIRQQLDRALSPELKQRLAELQQALQNLDPERTKNALQDLARAQEQLREAIERSRELFRRAAVEGDMANLAAESRELAREQQRWTEQVTSADSTRAAAEERALAERADSLAAALERLAPQVAPDDREGQLEEMAGQTAQAGALMQEAAQHAAQGRRSDARRSGEQAAQMLQPLGDRMQQAMQSLQQEWRSEVSAALDRALSETTRLAERQLDLADALRQGDASAETRSAQGAIEEGAEKLLEQVKEAAGKNALVSPQVGVALTQARQRMREAREAISTATPDPHGAAEAAGQAVDALNAASYELVRAQGEVSGAGSGSGLQEAMERMQQMAGQQGGLNREAAGLLPMAGQGGVRERLMEIGRQQRELAEQLERLRAGGNMPGAADLAAEARDLADRLEQGRLDRPTVERQERLFRRMLDAGRTLQGEERDDRKERESTSGSDENPRLPPALRELLQADDRAIRVPDWETMQRFSPEQRRLVVEYFRRLSDQVSP